MDLVISMNNVETHFTLNMLAKHTKTAGKALYGGSRLVLVVILKSYLLNSGYDYRK